MNDQYLGRAFHRKSALDANKDQKNASRLLKEATKGETLQEWFDKEKKKPSPKATDASYASEIQQKKNSIAEGKMLLSGKKKISGAKYSNAELAAIQRSVEKQEKELRDLEEKEGSN